MGRREHAHSGDAIRFCFATEWYELFLVEVIGAALIAAYAIMAVWSNMVEEWAAGNPVQAVVSIRVVEGHCRRERHKCK